MHHLQNLLDSYKYKFEHSLRWMGAVSILGVTVYVTCVWVLSDLEHLYQFLCALQGWEWCGVPEQTYPAGWGGVGPRTGAFGHCPAEAGGGREGCRWEREVSTALTLALQKPSNSAVKLGWCQIFARLFLCRTSWVSFESVLSEWIILICFSLKRLLSETLDDFLASEGWI